MRTNYLIKIFLLFLLVSCFKKRSCSKKEEDSLLPRLIIGRGKDDEQLWLQVDKRDGRENVWRLKVDPNDVTVDLESSLSPDVLYNCYDPGVIKKILEKKSGKFRAIIFERVSMLPLYWGEYLRKYLEENGSQFPDPDLVKLTYPDPKLVGTGGIIPMHPLSELINFTYQENNILRQYYDLLAPGGKFTFMSSSNVVNQYGIVFTVPSSQENRDLFKNNKIDDSEEYFRILFFEDGVKDEHLQDVYRSVFERAGFINIKFHTDPSYPQTVIYLTAEKEA